MFIGVKLDHITLRKMLLHEIEGMGMEKIDAWMKEHGYVTEKEQEPDGEEEVEDSDKAASKE